MLTHSDTASGDWIELLNTTDAAIDIGGWYLSDDENLPLKYEIPPDTTIPAHGFATFTELEHFGERFALSELGEEMVLQAARGGELLGFRALEDFGASDSGRTLGRYVTSTGGEDFVAMQEATFGAANADPLVGPVVMNEIMYHPGGEGLEFVELKNITDQDVPLFDPLHPENTWRFAGIGYQFPTGVTLRAGAVLLVVPIGADEFRSRMHIPAGVQVVAPRGDGDLPVVDRPSHQFAKLRSVRRGR